jgi:class 3 adenylate cyclase/TolB-like protein
LVRDHRRLAAIVSVDVVGYSRLMGRDESGTLAALKAHRRNLIDPKIAEYDGRIVKTMGDGLLLEFPSVVDAVRCAVDVQRGMTERNSGVPDDLRIEFRIGINVGDIIIDEGDIFGDGVNVAARIQMLAEPGGICVSRVVRDQVLDKLSFTFEEMGAQEVKNIARPVETYAVRTSFDEAVPQRVPSAHGRPAWRRRLVMSGRWWGVGALGLISVGIAGWLVPGYLQAPPKATPPLSLAILPISSAGDPVDGQFAESLAQDLTAALARWRWTTVASGREIAKFTGKDVDARDIGSKLNVRYVVDGQIRSDANQRAISVSLVDTKSGTLAWSDRLEFEASTPQRTVATRVSIRLRNAIYEAEMRRAVANPVPGSAWDFVLRGDWVYMEGMVTNPVRAARAARALYDEALRIDPNFVPALGSVSLLVFTLIENDLGADRSKYANELDESDRLTMRAVMIDGKDTFAWYARSVVLTASGRLDEAMAANVKAEMLDSSSSTYVANHAFIAMLSDRIDEARTYAHRAIGMDRGLLGEEGFSLYMLCMINVLEGRFDDAIPPCEKAAVISNQWLNHAWLVAAYAQRGEVSKASVAKGELLRRQPALTVDTFLKVEGGRASPGFLKRLDISVAEGLRKAGLPER